MKMCHSSGVFSGRSAAGVEFSRYSFERLKLLLHRASVLCVVIDRFDIEIFSAFEQTHCTLVACDSE